jgi:hypothetical protein
MLSAAVGRGFDLAIGGTRTPNLYRDLDLAWVKNTTLFRETGLEFRAELFNVTNKPAFAQPNGSFGSAAFGSITGTTTDPRVLQLAIKDKSVADKPSSVAQDVPSRVFAQATNSTWKPAIVRLDYRLQRWPHDIRPKHVSSPNSGLCFRVPSAFQQTANAQVRCCLMVDTIFGFLRIRRQGDAQFTSSTGGAKKLYSIRSAL